MLMSQFTLDEENLCKWTCVLLDVELQTNIFDFHSVCKKCSLDGNIFTMLQNGCLIKFSCTGS